MSAFHLDTNNDLALSTNSRGKKTLTIGKDEIENGTSKLHLRFQFFEGEWFADTREGVPYLKSLFVKNPDLSVITQILRSIILSIPVFGRVDKLTYAYDAQTRGFAFDFAATAKTGQKIEGGSGIPFVVDGRVIAKRSNTL